MKKKTQKIIVWVLVILMVLGFVATIASIFLSTQA